MRGLPVYFVVARDPAPQKAPLLPVQRRKNQRFGQVHYASGPQQCRPAIIAPRPPPHRARHQKIHQHQDAFLQQRSSPLGAWAHRARFPGKSYSRPPADPSRQRGGVGAESGQTSETHASQACASGS